MKGELPTVRVCPAPSPPLSARLVACVGGRVAGSEPLRVFTTIGRHRRLSRWWLPFAGTILMRGRLTRGETEVLVLRTAWNCGAWYEWVQHVPLAGRAGLRPVDVSALARGEVLQSWPARWQRLVQVADELHEVRVISDKTWDRFSAEFTTEECIEVCFVVGHYEMLAMTLNSLGVEPEPAALAVLDSKAAALADELAAQLTGLRSRPDRIGR